MNGIPLRNTSVARWGSVHWGTRFPVAGMRRGVPGRQYGVFVEEVLALGDRVRHHEGPDLPSTCFIMMVRWWSFGIVGGGQSVL